VCHLDVFLQIRIKYELSLKHIGQNEKSRIFLFCTVMFALSVHVQAASILDGDFAFFTLEMLDGFGMVNVSFAALVAHLGAAAVVFHVVGKVAGRDLFVANGTFFAMVCP
jgi:hypothetical protein